MNSSLSYLSQISDISQQNFFRYGVVLQGSDTWQRSLIQEYIDSSNPMNVFQIGGSPIIDAQKTTHVSMKKGHALLGRECHLLICDCSEGFDANGFSAALGALVGGGLLIVIPPHELVSSEQLDAGQSWLKLHFDKLIQLSECTAHYPLPQVQQSTSKEDLFYQQKQAVELIHKVVAGHRKRPLVITADRGRGKSSALGIAAAQLMKDKAIRIVITAPNSKSVQPVFSHAIALLEGVTQVRPNHIQCGNSELKFVAPDELIKSSVDCDLLLVDEAAAIPLPMLKRIVDIHHRLVFSTTVHGYEGSGRGFGLKFQVWLSESRKGWRLFEMDQPIRWNNEDPLEKWLFDAFLLNAEIPAQTPSHIKEHNSLTWQKLNKEDSAQQPQLLAQCFALLVNAHYQTSPNDLMQLLENPEMELYALLNEQYCVGCILAVREGGLGESLICDIQSGVRRPHGQLAPTLLANHLGVDEAASQQCIRVMRIATSPELQGKGLGSFMLNKLSESTTGCDYLATSFGATAELIRFWEKNDFVPVHIGHQRDQASGCHSLLMVRPIASIAKEWVSYSSRSFSDNLPCLLSSSLASIEIDMARALFPHKAIPGLDERQLRLIKNYTIGGNGFDSIGYLIERVLFGLSSTAYNEVSDLIFAKVVLKKDWKQCVELFQFSGRKQAEAQMRNDISGLIANLHCK
ncbi:GNAT family N-acetyltransferase [Vibrio makurazakiensis]|uniref:tRNA(Met) cytidine acetyltransferase TmcA n=1 Tax=Vibrio makurazakiensis TaxID=2910250 RepID=UPI003D0E2F28